MAKTEQTFEMPVFDFSESVSEEAAAELLKAKSERIEPGQYGFEIVEAAFAGPTKADPLWVKLKLKLAVANGTVHDTLLIPTKSSYLTYKDGKQTYPLRRLLGFLATLGESQNLPAIGKTLSKVLGKDGSKLVGRTGETRLDYTENRIAKNEDGQIALLDKKGKTMLDDAGEALTFGDFAAANAYAKENKIDTFGFVKVVEYVAPAESSTTDDTPF